MTLCLLLALSVSVIFTEGCAAANVQTTDSKPARIAKIAPELVTLYDQYSTYMSSHHTEAFRPANLPVSVVDNCVVIDAVASGDTEILKSDLESLGMQNAVAFGRIVSGELPIAAIPAMGALTSLQFARAATVSTRDGKPSSH